MSQGVTSGGWPSVSAFYSRPTTLEYFQPEQILIWGSVGEPGAF